MAEPKEAADIFTSSPQVPSKGSWIHEPGLDTPEVAMLGEASPDTDETPFSDAFVDQLEREAGIRSSPEGDSRCEKKRRTTKKKSSKLHSDEKLRLNLFRDYGIAMNSSMPEELSKVLHKIIDRPSSNADAEALEDVTNFLHAACVGHVESGAVESGCAKHFIKAITELAWATEAVVSQPNDWVSDLRLRKVSRRLRTTNRGSPVELSGTKAAGSPTCGIPTKPSLAIGVDRRSLLRSLRQPYGNAVNKTEQKLLEISRSQANTDELVLRINALDAALAFPFLVMDNAKVSEEQRMFDSENEAALTAGCALNALKRLEKLADTFLEGGEPRASAPQTMPTIFSVCADGRIFTLNVHWFGKDGSGRKSYCMRRVAVCSVDVLESLEPFMVKINNIIEWGLSDHTKKLSQQLEAILTRAEATEEGEDEDDREEATTEENE